MATNRERTLQRNVDCSCDKLLARPILLRRDVNACMRCGVVTMTDAIWDEPHPHVVEVHGYHVVSVGDEMLAWLGQWPRVAGTSASQPEVFLSANARIADVASLAEIEREAAAAQSSLAYAERLRASGIPTSPPPSSNPAGDVGLPAGITYLLADFATMWNAAQLTDVSPLRAVQEFAARGCAARLVDAILVKRPSFAVEVADLLREPDEKRREIGYALVERRALAHEEVITAMRERLTQVELTQQELHVALIALEALEARAAKSFLPELQAIAARVASNYYEHKRVVDVATRIEARGSAASP